MHFVPSIGIEETFYSESQTPYQDHYHAIGTDLVRSARDFSLDVILPSLEHIYDKKTFLGDKLKHVIEPRATYNYVTGIGTDFDRFIRFDENDILANTSEVDISLTNRIYAKRGQGRAGGFQLGDRAEAVFRSDLRRRPDSRPAQRIRQHRGPDRLRLSGGAAEHLAGGLHVARDAHQRPYHPVADGLRSPRVHCLIVNSTISVDYRWKKCYSFQAATTKCTAIRC